MHQLCLEFSTQASAPPAPSRSCAPQLPVPKAVQWKAKCQEWGWGERRLRGLFRMPQQPTRLAALPSEASFSLFFLFFSVLWSLCPPGLCLLPSPHRAWRQPSDPSDSLCTPGPFSSPRTGLLPNPLPRTFPNSACLCKVLWWKGRWGETRDVSVEIQEKEKQTQ